MARNRRTFTKEFKLGILAEIDAGATITQAARKHGIHPETLRLWKRQEHKYGDRAFAGHGNAYTDEARIAELERTIGQLTIENRFLKNSMPRSRSSTARATTGGNRADPQ